MTRTGFGSHPMAHALERIGFADSVASASAIPSSSAARLRGIDRALGGSAVQGMAQPGRLCLTGMPSARGAAGSAMTHGTLRSSDAEALPVCILKRTAEAAAGARCVQTVAIRLGVTPKLASSLLRRAAAEGLIPSGVLPRKRNRVVRVDPETLSQAIDGARSVREVSARLGLPYAWTRSNLRLAVRNGAIPASAVPDGRQSRRKKPRTATPAVVRVPPPPEVICALREQGLTYREIGDRLGFSGERIRQILKSVGKDGRLPAKPGAVKIPKRVAAVLDEAHELARSGETLAEISRRLRVHPNLLSSALAERFGFRFRVGSRPKPGRDEEVAKLHAEGLSQSDIGRRLGIAQGHVSKIFKRLGLACGGAQRRHADKQHQD